MSDHEDTDTGRELTDAELSAYVVANPFAHVTHGEIRRLFNFGEKVMRNLVAMNPPSVARKINPAHFQQWLWENREVLRKANL